MISHFILYISDHMQFVNLIHLKGINAKHKSSGIYDTFWRELAFREDGLASLSLKSRDNEKLNSPEGNVILN